MLWLLEELGCEYEVKRYERDAKTMLAPPELREVHPLGKSPVITDQGETIAETGAITEYLVERYGQGRLIPPPGTPERRRYTYWLHYAEGSAMPPLVMKLIFTRISEAPMPFFVRPIARRIARLVQDQYIDPTLAAHVALWESELAKSAWFAGPEFTAADIMLSFPLEAAAQRATLGPRATAFLTAIHDRPAYRRALTRGGPYDFLRE